MPESRFVVATTIFVFCKSMFGSVAEGKLEPLMRD